MSSQNLKRPQSQTDQPPSPPALRRKVAADKKATSSVFDPNLLRIYSWNVNGVNPLLQKRLNFQLSQNSPANPLRSFLERHVWPHFLCLQEVKISPKDEATQRRLQQAANEGVNSEESSHYTYTVHFSLPRDKFNATGFGGKVHGVATLIRDDVRLKFGSVSTSKPEWDLEGRVLIHSLPDLTVINGYWVNGTTNPYRNPTDGVVEGTRHDHKLRFHKHMLELAKSLTEGKEGKYVVLIGDMNVARSTIDGHPNLRTSPVQHVKNRADFNSKFFDKDTKNAYDGVDVFRELHGDTQKFTYYPRGRPWGESCDRVDLIIVNRGLKDVGAVAETDICDNPQGRGHSDHVPLWLAIDAARIKEVEQDTKG